MFKKIAWPFMMGISVLMIVIFIIGFLRVMAITNGDELLQTDQSINGDDQLNDEANSVNKSFNGKQEILILGDSIGAGVGDERNLGIGERYVNQLEFEESDLVEVINFSVPGATTYDLSEVISSREIDEAIQKASLIVISIGGNDLNPLRNSDATLQIVNFEESLSDHLNAFNDVIKEIRKLNLTASIAVLELYNPYDDVNKEDIRMVQKWNYQTRINLLEFEKTNMIPLYDVFKMNLGKLLSIDRFHPSGDGYELIAEMLHKIVKLEK